MRRRGIADEIMAAFDPILGGLGFTAAIIGEDCVHYRKGGLVVRVQRDLVNETTCSLWFPETNKVYTIWHLVAWAGVTLPDLLPKTDEARRELLQWFARFIVEHCKPLLEMDEAAFDSLDSAAIAANKKYAHSLEVRQAMGYADVALRRGDYHTAVRSLSEFESEIDDEHRRKLEQLRSYLTDGGQK